VQVNCVGSSGYGKEYINLLNFQRGVSDVADAVSCVEYLVKEGLIDPNRVGITGHSASGYVVRVSGCLGRRDSGIGGFLICKLWLMKPTNSSLSTCSRHASRPTPSPEDAERIIEERSPIHWTQNVKAPVLIPSGEVGEIVPSARHI
jgi:hypothetical protein